MNTNVTNFIANSNVLVTGGTGFLGKVLIEKLLRSQTNIKKLYILIRSKDGKDVQERLQSDILKKPLFEKFRKEETNYVSKIIVMEGDICQKHLGLSENDRTILLKEVNIIYNCAGSTNLKSTLKDSIASNCKSVSELLKLCREMRNLKSVVLLSTIHANYWNRKIIEEKIHDSPISASLILSMCEEMNDELMQKLTEPLLSGYPNSYTFSKSIMEKLILEKFSDLPIVLLRSATVISAYKNPLPGWIEDNNQHMNMVYKVHLGILRVLNVNMEMKTHLVPVDYCVNALICSSWHGVKRRMIQYDNDILVYNYIFEKRKRTWRFYLNSTMETDVKLGKSIWKPTYISSENVFLYYIFRFFCHSLPGAFMDIGLLILGYEAKFLHMYDEIYANVQKLAYLFGREWRCRETNVTRMLSELSSEEQQYYPVDINQIPCNAYAQNICTGMKLYMAKESVDSNDKHLRRHKRLAVLHFVLTYTFWGLFTVFIFLLLRRIYNALWVAILMIFM